MKPSVAHTQLMQMVAEVVETHLYEKLGTDSVRRVTDCDFLVKAKTDDGEKSVRVSIRKA